MERQMSTESQEMMASIQKAWTAAGRVADAEICVTRMLNTPSTAWSSYLGGLHASARNSGRTTSDLDGIIKLKALSRHGDGLCG